nr:C40 family peptidase [Desulfobulbaceae bacterium]
MAKETFKIIHISFLVDKVFTVLIFSWLALGQSSCSSITSEDISPQLPPLKTPVTRTAPALGYVLQFGAFSQLANALRLTESLNDSGFEAYYYIDDDALYKVRMGNFTSVKLAENHARALLDRQLITDYYIVSPSSYSVNYDQSSEAVRHNIIQTAQRFIGIPYKWGGTSPDEGFDCSGLSMVVYSLNGMVLPRTSRTQFMEGQEISINDLQPADLVFFSTDMSGKVNHVGVYAGDGIFIHAPRSGKKIKKARLESSYFGKRFVGARTFL